MLIPIRVPVDAPAFLIGGERCLPSDHPLADALCPVCDQPMAGEPVTLVYIGIAPDDRKERGWTNGAAVAVHVVCAPPGAKSEE